MPVGLNRSHPNIVLWSVFKGGKEMAKMNLRLLALAALCCVVAVGPASAMTHVVGGSFGWNIPNTTTFYKDWAKPRTFGVGDRLIFPFRMGMHTVLEVTKQDFDHCTQLEAVDMFYKGPTLVNLTRTGDYYFYSGVGKQCESGQKLAITVTNEKGSAGAPALLNSNDTEKELGVQRMILKPEAAPAPAPPMSSTGCSISSIGMVSGLMGFFLFLFV